MRIAATADLHFAPANQVVLRDQLSRARDEADVLVLAGDLTNYGQPAEMEPLLNALVRLRVASIDEALKLERGMSQLRTPKRVVVLHYSPIAATVRGEDPEVTPFLGTSRLAEVIDRHGADLVVHGHAHHGTLEGQTLAGVPVRNVAITLLQAQPNPSTYRVFDI